MKTCPKCGNTIHNDNARFCKECGTDLFGKNDGGIWLGDPQKEPTPSTKSKNTNIPIAKIGVITAVVVALFLIIFLAFSGGKEESDVTATEPVNTLQKTTSPQKTVEPVKETQQSEEAQTATSTIDKMAVQEKVVTKPAEVEKTEDSKKNRLSTALAKGDYKQVQILANEGYAPAYVPLAKYYLNNNEYDDADRYAKKAKSAGQSGAQAIIKTLENLGYYD